MLINLIHEMLQDLAERLFGRRFHRHRWRTTYTNQWQIATRQECRCGAWRAVEVQSPLQWRWRYSDGQTDPWRHIGSDELVEEQEAAPEGSTS